MGHGGWGLVWLIKDLMGTAQAPAPPVSTVRLPHAPQALPDGVAACGAGQTEQVVAPASGA
jgi:hypothetical protein